MIDVVVFRGVMLAEVIPLIIFLLFVEGNLMVPCATPAVGIAAACIPESAIECSAPSFRTAAVLSTMVGLNILVHLIRLVCRWFPALPPESIESWRRQSGNEAAARQELVHFCTFLDSRCGVTGCLFVDIILVVIDGSSRRRDTPLMLVDYCCEAEMEGLVVFPQQMEEEHRASHKDCNAHNRSHDEKVIRLVVGRTPPSGSVACRVLSVARVSNGRRACCIPHEIEFPLPVTPSGDVARCAPDIIREALIVRVPSEHDAEIRQAEYDLEDGRQDDADVHDGGTPGSFA